MKADVATEITSRPLNVSKDCIVRTTNVFPVAPCVSRKNRRRLLEFCDFSHTGENESSSETPGSISPTTALKTSFYPLLKVFTEIFIPSR